MMKNVLTVFALLVLSSGAFAQATDPVFTQYTNTPLRINPANAGLFAGRARIIGNYKRQWESFGDPFQSIAASGDFQVTREMSGADFFAIGFDAVQDQAGSTGLKNFGFNGTVAYTKAIDGAKSSFLSVGFQGGLVQRSINPTGINWGSQWTQYGFDQTIQTPDASMDETVSYFDLGAGVNYFYSRPDDLLKFYIGVAGYHLTEPKYSFLGNDEAFVDRNFKINAGLKYSFGTGDAYSVFPNILYSFQGPSTVVIYGMDFEYMIEGGSRHTGTVKHTSVAVGLYNRWNKTITPVVKLNKAGFTLAFSYDFEIGNVTRVTNGMGGMEFSLQFRQGFRTGRSSKNINNAFL